MFNLDKNMAVKGLRRPEKKLKIQIQRPNPLLICLTTLQRMKGLFVIK